MILGNSEVFCVIGNPVKHSKSPIIHNFIFQKLGINAVYVPFEVKDLKVFFSFVRDVGIKGISVTIPHKVNSINFVDKVDEIALRIGAINTIKNNDSFLEAYNTDIQGIVKSFETRGIKSLEGKNALIIGSGGVSRSCIWAFIKMEISKITVTGRTPEKVSKLIQEIKPFFSNIFEESLLNIKNIINDTNVIANCTPIGMYPNVEECPIDPSLISKDHIIFDTVYTPLETKFLKFGKDVGAKVIYGMDMFVFQALEQQRIWFNNSEIYSLKDAVINLLTQTH